MKKLIAFVLVIAVLFSFTACGKETEQNETTVATDASVEVTTEAGGDTPAYQLRDAFMEAAAVDGASAMDVAAALSANELLPFMPACDAIEPGYLNGFTTEITGFKSGAFFGPMIGSIPFVGYVFEMDEGADAAAFVDTLKANADLRWNICTAADEMVSAVSGNLVYFVMAPATFEE